MNAAVPHTLGKPPRFGEFPEPTSGENQAIVHKCLGSALKWRVAFNVSFRQTCVTDAPKSGSALNPTEVTNPLTGTETLACCADSHLQDRRF